MEYRKDLGLIKGGNLFRGRICGRILRDEAPMSIDVDVHHVPVFKTPRRARNCDLLIDQCLHVGILSTEITGVAEKAVVSHVNDEGTYFSVSESAVTGETDSA